MVKPPKKIADYADQLRPPIARSEGSTPSERYLARLADDTFLKLWSYPNPYRSQKLGGAGDGKELCDLLVVCDPHVILFSEKDITWTDKPIEVAWPRWFRKAVEASATQLRGAERWISEFPDRIFLDAKCETPFPLDLPPVERRRVHRIVVAGGAAEACRKHFEGGLGTFIVKPDLKSADHCNVDPGVFSPFSIGDIDPAGDFVHVFDEVSLDIVMRELDTIADFTDYLDKRAAFLRSGHLAMAHGEEDLLAYYAVHINAEGDHDFAPPTGKTWSDVTPFLIGPGVYTDLITSPQYLAKKEADEVSYAWDDLISLFTNRMLDGTSIVLPGYTYALNKSEIGVRLMALQNRYLRRGLGDAVVGALQEGRETDKFFRVMISGPTSKQNETGFFILTLKYPEFLDDRGATISIGSSARISSKSTPSPCSCAGVILSAWSGSAWSRRGRGAAALRTWSMRRSANGQMPTARGSSKTSISSGL